MRLPVFPERSCREPVDGNYGQVGTCSVVTNHPGPCASLSVSASVTRRDAWEKANPGWENELAGDDPFV
jgi:hypothetical protein